MPAPPPLHNYAMRSKSSKRRTVEGGSTKPTQGADTGTVTIAKARAGRMAATAEDALAGATACMTLNTGQWWQSALTERAMPKARRGACPPRPEAAGGLEAW